MADMREEQRVGLDYLRDLTTLLQRSRALHPTDGLYEAADFQWWWLRERPTDEIGQLLWFDEAGRPVAAVIITEWPDRIALDPIVLPGASPDVVAMVVDRGLAYAAACGYESFELEVARDDEVLIETLTGHGFALKEEGYIEAWLPTHARPPVSSLHDGYRATTRAETMDRPHHMVPRAGPDVAERLLQTSLYRTDLDVLILDGEGNCASNGLFWFDPTTATGLVEPMRTEDEHQRRGLARHVLTLGIDLLAQAGAERIKICFEAGNPGASGLYLDVGFEPAKQTDMYARS